MLGEQNQTVPRKQRASKKAVVLGGSLLCAACLSGAALMYGSNETMIESEAFTPREGRSHGFLGYYFENTEMTWNEGKAFCEARGMVLATVDSKWKLDDARAASGNQNVWIGLRSRTDQQSNKNAWRWQSGSPTGFGDWAPWAANEPNQITGEFCTEMMPNGQWNNLPCNTAAWKRRVLCDKSPYVGPYVVHGLPFGVKFDNANNKCRKRYGSNLATLTSQASLKSAMSLIPVDQAHSAWVGVRIDPFVAWHPNSFGYVSGMPVLDGQLRWLPNEPNNAGNNENCAEMVRDGRLNDLSCSGARNYYICDKSNLKPDYFVSKVERLAAMRPRRDYKVPALMLEFRGRTTTRLAFKLKINGLMPDWAAIFHLGNVNRERNPGIWTYPNSNRVIFIQSSVGNWNLGCGPASALAIGTEYRIIVYTHPGLHEVRYNGVVACSNAGTIAPPADPQPVYIGDPWYEPANAIIKDLYYRIE